LSKQPVVSAYFVASTKIPKLANRPLSSLQKKKLSIYANTKVQLQILLGYQTMQTSGEYLWTCQPGHLLVLLEITVPRTMYGKVSFPLVQIGLDHYESGCVSAALRRLIVNLRLLRRSLGQIRRCLGLTGGTLGRLEVPWADWRRLRQTGGVLGKLEASQV